MFESRSIISRFDSRRLLNSCVMLSTVRPKTDWKPRNARARTGPLACESRLDLDPCEEGEEGRDLDSVEAGSLDEAVLLGEEDLLEAGDEDGGLECVCDKVDDTSSSGREPASEGTM